ncbi:hypothetical protein [Thalassobacillus hwangdonensis]|uniref:MetS family NSS transporter small subunit n=1 Tax=Thalassobacillus hwangdonensis TaxID=546108 RepID=A0ABW3L4F1_9BACI
MDPSAIFIMVLGSLITWGLPLAVIIGVIILVKKMNRIEKKLNEK